MFATFQNKTNNIVFKYQCKFLTKKTIKDTDGKKKEFWYMKQEDSNVPITMLAKDWRFLTIES